MIKQEIWQGGVYEGLVVDSQEAEQRAKDWQQVIEDREWLEQHKAGYYVQSYGEWFRDWMEFYSILFNAIPGIVGLGVCFYILIRVFFPWVG